MGYEWFYEGFSAEPYAYNRRNKGLFHSINTVIMDFIALLPYINWHADNISLPQLWYKYGCMMQLQKHIAQNTRLSCWQ